MLIPPRKAKYKQGQRQTSYGVNRAVRHCLIGRCTGNPLRFGKNRRRQIVVFALFGKPQVHLCFQKLQLEVGRMVRLQCKRQPNEQVFTTRRTVRSNRRDRVPCAVLHQRLQLPTLPALPVQRSLRWFGHAARRAPGEFMRELINPDVPRTGAGELEDN